jgi:7-carboxy-7-deazaguanine synthase
VKISEIFYSIQGEGTLLGVPSVFVRTSGCNLRCTWCDTPYTSWNPEGSDMSNDAILQTVMDFGCRHIVLTGGEPMIAPGVADLTRLFRDAGLHITIETAGTVFAEVACHLMSISPKLANSTPTERDGGRWAVMHERQRFQPDVLKKLMAAHDYQLKFVVAAASDVVELESMRLELNAPVEKVLVMPEGATREAMQQRGLWLAELCKQHGYRFSPRLHIDIWGDKRGV